ncbi:SDR family oxidoreductase [Streptomyces sp. NPDC059009]|uniref:SDR family oxidoreductase n=1 Tax=Streptomyces sp. NPDC059009 TaxID=3346694 RepID=UPI0036C7DE25
MLLGRIVDQPVEEWDRMIDLNIKGVLDGIRAVLPGMVERGAGTIINVSSVAGRKTFPNHTAYVGTKFAVHAMSENLREEVAPSRRRWWPTRSPTPTSSPATSRSARSCWRRPARRADT